MTNEELLIPRVVCMGGSGPGKPIHPNNCYLTSGDILTRFNERSWKSKEWDMNLYFQDDWVEKFPNLFQPLEWWQERKKEDMPAYVKQTGFVDSKNRPIPDVVLKVKEHFSAGTGDWREDTIEIFCVSELFIKYPQTHGYIEFEPATEEEYINYENTKTQQNEC